MTEKHNPTGVLTRFIAELAIPVTRQSISDELQKHPDSAYRLRFDQLPDIPLPFITLLSNKNYAVVARWVEKQVTLSNERPNNKALDNLKIGNLGYPNLCFPCLNIQFPTTETT